MISVPSAVSPVETPRLILTHANIPPVQEEVASFLGTMSPR
jgi:hypothetical protein